MIRAERMARLKEKESRDSPEQQTQPASFSIDKNLESLGIAPVSWVVDQRRTTATIIITIAIIIVVFIISTMIR